MGFLLDSDVLIASERDEDTWDALLERLGEETPGIAAISASELLHGVHRATGAQRKARREAFVGTVLSSLTIFPFGLEAARVHARIWADLKAAGRLIGAHDLIIAATALAEDLPLLTLNQGEFRRVEGLRLIGGL